MLGWSEERFELATPRKIVNQIRQHIKFVNPENKKNNNQKSNNESQSKARSEKFSYGRID